MVSSVLPVNFTFASQTAAGERFPQSIIASSSIETSPHLLNLKATQQGDAEPKKASGFDLDMTNVLTAQINSQIYVLVTDSSLRVTEAKVRTVSDQLIDLVPSTATSQTSNAFSLANIPVGVYTLDVITQKGNTKAAYEGILVISQQPTIVINETIKNVINQEINQDTRIDIDTKIIFKNKKCSNKSGSSGLGYPYERRTECEYEEWQECKNKGIGNTDRCETLNEMFFDDCDIPGVTNKKECDDYWNSIGKPPEKCPPGQAGTPPNCKPVNSCGCPIGADCPDMVCEPGQPPPTARPPPFFSISPPTPPPTPPPGEEPIQPFVQEPPGEEPPSDDGDNGDGNGGDGDGGGEDGGDGGGGEVEG
jgi:hypothetical protein